MGAGLKEVAYRSGEAGSHGGDQHMSDIRTRGYMYGQHYGQDIM